MKAVVPKEFKDLDPELIQLSLKVQLSTILCIFCFDKPDNFFFEEKA